MSISTDQWRASIGLFYGQVYGHIRIKLSIGKCDLKVVIVMLCFFAAFAFLLLLKHGDVEINSGPKKKEARFFSCFHCNVNSILAHNKLSLLEAYNTVYKYDILYISETYLDSSVSLDDITLSLPVIILFNLIILAICLYYKENLSLISINVPFLSQCVLCEVTLQIRKG